MDLTPAALARPVARLVAAAQNALEVARFGGLDTGEEPAPHEVVTEQPMYRLRRYFPGPAPGGPTQRPAVLLVPPLMLAADVYDVSPRASAVRALHDHGSDAWVVDFGAPERQAGGLERTLADHVLAVSDAVERVGKASGRPVHLAGYSQGGMFCYQVAGYRRSEGLASLVTFGSPVDTRGRPLPGSAEVRIAAYDPDSGQLTSAPDGLAVPCRAVGMLLARSDMAQGGLLGRPRRGVFDRDDAWEVTGDLFRQDDDGDFWLVDHAADLIHTRWGTVPSIPVEDALTALDAVDLAVAYGVPTDREAEEVVAAVTVREGRELDGGALARAVLDLDEPGRPVHVRIVDRIPVTAWGRPIKAPLRAEGWKETGGWSWDRASRTYVPA